MAATDTETIDQLRRRNVMLQAWAEVMTKAMMDACKIGRWDWAQPWIEKADQAARDAEDRL